MPRSRPPVPYVTRRRWTIEDARAALSACDASGLSMLAFAEREGIDPRRLHRWRRTVAVDRPAPAPELVEVRLRSAEPEPVEITLRSGRLVRVSETIDPAALERIVRALEEPTSC
jgi:transposase-like protein